MNNDIDNDLPTINENSALSYVKDAFGISESKHNEIYENVKSKESPEIAIESEPLSEMIDTKDETHKKESYCFLTRKVNNFEALEAHSCLNKILLKHELETSQTPYYYWSGKFSLLASTILLMHSEFRYLSASDLALSQWSAFAEIHQQHPLDLKVFIVALDSIVEVFKDDETVIAENFMFNSARVFIPACFGMPNVVTGLKELVPSQDLDRLKTKDEQTTKMFWDAMQTLSKSSLQFISKLYQENDLDYIKIEILRKTFMIFNRVKNIEESEISKAFEETIKEAIAIGTSDYLSEVINETVLGSENNENRLDELFRVISLSFDKCINMSERFGFMFEE